MVSLAIHSGGMQIVKSAADYGIEWRRRLAGDFALRCVIPQTAGETPAPPNSARHQREDFFGCKPRSDITFCKSFQTSLFAAGLRSR